eukprot:16588-Heterococcus_DN1.PRE.1
MSSGIAPTHKLLCAVSQCDCLQASLQYTSPQSCEQGTTSLSQPSCVYTVCVLQQYASTCNRTVKCRRLSNSQQRMQGGCTAVSSNFHVACDDSWNSLYTVGRPFVRSCTRLRGISLTTAQKPALIPAAELSQRSRNSLHTRGVAVVCICEATAAISAKQ